MKAFPAHNAVWVEHLPYWAPGKLFPGSKSHYRADIETGWEMAKAVPPAPPYTDEELEIQQFNAGIAAHTAAFADIIGHYTRWLYGQERTNAIITILVIAWNRRHEWTFGQRGWFYSVCAEATS